MILSRSLPRIRRSARAFARAPGLTSALLLTIALGVGSNAAVYGFLQGLTHPVSLVSGSKGVVSIFREDRGNEPGPFSPDAYQLLRNNGEKLFEWVGAARIQARSVFVHGHSQIATVAAVTPELGEALDVRVDDGVVISRRLWQSEFDGKESALDSKVRIGDRELRIAGVAPEQLDGLYSDQSVDVWMRATRNYLEGGNRERGDLWILGRLRPGISAFRAQDALRFGSASFREVSVTPFTGIAPKMIRGLTGVGMFLSFSAALVFLVACINVASFLLGRALKRSHETSLRIALGATRAELLRDLFADSVVISVAGGSLGLLLGILTARGLPAFLFDEDAARLRFAPHMLPIVGAALACVAIAVVCGMIPVFGTVTDRPWTVLQRETGSPSKSIQRLRSGLVIAQIAASCVLVICTAILLAGLHSELKTSAGHRLGNPILLTVQALPGPDGPEVDPKVFSEVEKAANTVGGLSASAWSARVPGNQPLWQTFRIQREAQQYRDVALDVAWLTPDSLRELNPMPVAGRMFEPNDHGRRVAVVNEQAAAELFGKASVGVVIRDAADAPVEIVGMVEEADTKGSSDQRGTEAAHRERRPTIYYGFVESDAPSTIRDARFRVPVEPTGRAEELSANVVSDGYFRALDMPLAAGRGFSEYRVNGEGRQAVVNQEAADLYFGGKPLGAGVIDENGVRTEIVGVVRSQVFGRFEKHAEPAIYFPMWQDTPARMTLMLKHSEWNKAKASELRRKIEGVPGLAPGPVDINTFDSQLAQSGVAALRIATLIGSVSAASALILSILGLIGVQGDVERQRQQDRALRIALGSQRWRIVFLVMRDAGRLAMIGTAIGTLVSVLLLRVLRADIAEISAPPLQVWLIAPLLPMAAVMLTSMIPAGRASVVSPATIMRER